MADNPMKKYQELAEQIVKESDLGRRMDIFLIVQSKNTTKIENASAALAGRLGCSNSEARIAMKEYVAHLKKYDPALLKELQ